MSLLRAAFTILGGASKGFNEGKIATRAAQQRAKELEDTIENLRQRLRPTPKLLQKDIENF